MLKLQSSVLLIYFILVFTGISFGQVNKNGLLEIRNYSPDEYNAHAQNWAIVKDKRGVMYFGNNYGLLEFNGAKWELYKNETSSTIRSLATDDDGFVYYGASQDFGVFLPDSTGKLKSVSIYQAYNPGNADFNTIWGIHQIGKYIYFQSNEKIFKVERPISEYNLKNIQKRTKVYTATNSFHWSFDVYNKFYVREQGSGILVEENNELKLIPGSEIFAKERVYVMLPYANNKILVCSRESGLYIYDPHSLNKPFTKLESEASDLLVKSLIYGGVSLPGNKYAISTLYNGIVIFDSDGKILEQINADAGFDDNQILSIFYDNKEDNLWFAAAEKGIYKTKIANPFREWTRKNGLNGIVADIVRFDSKIYAATSNGVFVLDDHMEGFSHFVPLTQIPYESWNFLIFNEPNSEKKHLLVGTTGGVFEIGNGKAEKIVDNAIVLQLHQSVKAPEKVFVGYIDGIGAIEFDKKKNKWKQLSRNEKINNTIRSIFEKKDGKLYLGTQAAGVIKLNDLYDEHSHVIDTAQGLSLDGSEFRVYEIEKNLIIAGPKGLFNYDEQNDIVTPFDKLGEEYTNQELGVYGLVKTGDTYWLSIYSNSIENRAVQGIIRIQKKQDKYIPDTTFSRNIPQKVALAMYDDGDYFWIGNEKGLFKFNKISKTNYNEPFNVNIFSISTEDSILFSGTFYETKDSVVYITLHQNEKLKPKLAYKNNQVTFEYASLFYDKEENTEYSFRLIGASEKWSKWTKETKFTYTNLSPNTYLFEIRARNIYGTISKIGSYEFTVLPPWYMTKWALALFFIAAIGFVWLIVRLNTRRLKKDKERLEKIVKARTAEIRQKNVELETQKEEISAQRDEIEAQRDYVIQQKEQIEEQHDKILEQKKNITDSILYASRIQEALLPPRTLLSEMMPEHFILFKPRDIVSGDFYWASKKNSKTIVVAGDCTGHGVPGAFMSMLGISYLNELVSKAENLHANQILNDLKENIKRSLRQTGKDNEAKDGMDMALCIIDSEKMQMEFAGAFNSLLLIRDNQIIKYEADRMPVGIYVKDRGSFTNHLIDMQPGDNYYMFSDGYIDQFGGERGTKLMTKRFKDLLLKNHKKPAEEQRKALDDFLTYWQSFTNEEGETYKQLDDILVIGLRI